MKYSVILPASNSFDKGCGENTPTCRKQFTLRCLSSGFSAFRSRTSILRYATQEVFTLPLQSSEAAYRFFVLRGQEVLTLPLQSSAAAYRFLRYAT
jgi:hypothetical protein